MGSELDRLLPLWILLAMAAGLLLGRVVPNLQAVLGAVTVGQTSVPIALGLLMMLYPVLAKVRYGSWVLFFGIAGCSPWRWLWCGAWAPC